MRDNAMNRPDELAAALQLARDTAAAAGRLAMTFFRQDLRVEKKGAIDLVTEADLAVESLVLERLRAGWPGGVCLAEETGGADDGGDVWVVDPIDGTTNFAHGYPVFGVSIALRRAGREVVGVVDAPALGECFWAADGQGAWRNGVRLRVSTVGAVSEAMLCTGFPYDVQRHPEDVMADLGRFLRRAQAVRRDGSAALDLCFLAAGRFDGFWERRLHPWDTAAGVLLVREAGGRVSRFDGAPFDIFDQQVLASNGRIHDEMLTILA